MARILVVDDEQSIRNTLRDILEFESYIVDEASDGMDCLAKVKQNNYDVIIMDVKMPKLDGMEALEKIQSINPDIPIVIISGHGNIDTAVEAVKKGAFDFIQKPMDLNRLLITIRNAMDKSSLIVEKKVLQRKVAKTQVVSIVGSSEPIKKILETVETVAPTEARVLINGKNGTGKELIARWLHEKSNRRENAIVEVNCAAIPSELIESELFGHEKGSFTSAHKQRLGKFELAHGGTLFLDEIGDMSLSAQAKVLRALQENKITRVGGEKELSVDVRIIAATNKDLRKEIAKGNFREDLYHRLAVIVLEVPALDDRKEDIPELANHFAKIICEEYNMPLKTFDDNAIEALQQNNWTGNIRELRNVVERLIILSKDQITKNDVDVFVKPFSGKKSVVEELISRYDSLEELQDYIKQEYNALKKSSLV
ncbi:MAG: sigma-54-dependent Fis family transcriptional regulator [Saprospiraceae bacterium]|nr:sigma-54-dependent Fis family transcriptional regulator [Saprospiraceae bacterium]